MTTKHYDYIAIGGGSGGIASANRAASYGKKCAIIEAKELGGTCVNVGCVPKKIMWYGAQIAEAIKNYGPDYGFDTTINHFSWKKLIESRTAYIDRIHQSYDRVLTNNNVDVIKGYAKFVDQKTIEVNGEHYTAEHILIAVGGVPSIPNIPGTEYGIDSDGFFALTEQPKRVAIVGAGYVACEIAGVLYALGSEVHQFILADKCELQISYAIGVAEPTSIYVNTFGTEKIAHHQIIALIKQFFDLRPYGLIEMLDLIKPIYQQTATYGHFGRDIFPWENTDKAELLRNATNLK